MWRRSAAALLTASMVSGCSFVTVRRPSPMHGCTRGMAAPVIDTLAAGGLGLIGSAAVAASQDHMNSQTDRDVGTFFAWTLLVPAAVYAVSAVYGFVEVSECRDAVDAQYQNMMQPVPLARPAGAPPGWAPYPPGTPYPPTPYTYPYVPPAPPPASSPAQTPGWSPNPVAKPHT